MSTASPDVEMSIKFDNAEEMFFSGESVSGFVTSKVNAWLKVSVLKVVLLGEYCLFKKDGGNFSTKIVNETVKLAMDGKVSAIPVGTYESAFSFKLGATFPSSVDSVVGSILYKVVARCDYQLDENSDIKTLHVVSYISVSRKLELQDYPFAMVATRAHRRVASGGVCSFLFFACCGDELLVNVETPRRAYVCGEPIILSATIINKTSHVISESKIELFQVLKTPYMKKKVSVVRSARGIVLKYSNRVWKNDILTIPALPPSDDDPNLVIQYKVGISLTRDDEKRIRVSMPIIIGNVPLNDGLIESQGKELSFAFRGGGDAQHEFVPSYLVYRFFENAEAADPSAPEPDYESSQMQDVPLERCTALEESNL